MKRGIFGIALKQVVNYFRNRDNITGAGDEDHTHHPKSSSQMLPMKAPTTKALSQIETTFLKITI